METGAADRVYVAAAVRPGKTELKVGLYGDITLLDVLPAISDGTLFFRTRGKLIASGTKGAGQ